MKRIRIGDYLARLFGIYSFRTISENYLDATGKYEYGDDDLRYLVSSFEVISFLTNQGFTLVWAQKRGPSLGKIKKLIRLLPGMEYYGTELFAIFEKKYS